MRNAFTLIELVVVVAIIAVLSTIATLSLGGTMDRYHLARAAETVERFDARARREAKVSGGIVEASIRRRRGQLCIDASGQENDATFELPSRVQVGGMRLRRQVSVGDGLVFQVDAKGQSPCYAIELRRGKMTRWMLVLGISGQVIPLDDEGQVDALLSL